jgi:hypothetical protein
LGGGWRLPTKIELESILDDTRTNPAIDPAVFPGTPTQLFWTASPDVSTPGNAWYVAFNSGNVYSNRVSSGYRVRCVR